MDLQKLAFGLRCATGAYSMAFAAITILPEKNIKDDYLVAAILSPIISTVILAFFPLTVPGFSISISDNYIAFPFAAATMVAYCRHKKPSIKAAVTCASITILPALAASVIDCYAAGGGLTDFAKSLTH
ncbi:MAG: hypothetical protein LW825_05740 [Candidatus Jidaibacter sp.]|jgi:hypothetical protein|nr:hypothetical protein [Candidatus Jidaibacter sp.]